MSTCVNKDNPIYCVYVKITYMFCASLMGELKKMSGLYFFIDMCSYYYTYTLKKEIKISNYALYRYIGVSF